MRVGLWRVGSRRAVVDARKRWLESMLLDEEG